MKGASREPVHPGEARAEDFLAPLGLTQNQLGRELGISPRWVDEIVHGKRRITADTAPRRARYLGTTPRFWLNLQASYDLALAEDLLGERLAREVKPREGSESVRVA